MDLELKLAAIKAQLAKLLEVQESELLVDLLLEPLSNWDSLTKVTLLGELNFHHGLFLEPWLLDEVETVGELLGVISAHAVAAASASA